jgi:hypothetical protein
MSTTKYTQFAFNANEVAPSAPGGAIPEGNYLFAIEDMEIKPTNNGGGEYIATVLVIQEGEYKGRKVFDNINIKNDNPVAVEMGLAALSAICHATETYEISDLTELYGKPFMGKVIVRKERSVDRDGNEVKKDDPACTKTYEAKNEFKGAILTKEAAGKAPAKAASGPAKSAGPGKPGAGGPGKPGAAGPGKPGAGPGKPATPPKKKDDRKFYFYESDSSFPEMTGDQVQEAVNAGNITEEHFIMLDGEDDWQAPSFYKFAKVEAPKAGPGKPGAAKAGAPGKPPWAK